MLSTRLEEVHPLSVPVGYSLTSPEGFMASAASPERLASGRQVQTLAAIDIGTNSIHMVVAKINAELATFEITDAEKSTVRLGERSPETGNLTPEAIKRAIAALHRCYDIARGAHVDQIIAVATSAVREAPNGRAFIDRVATEVGLQINLISGEEEARRIYLGVLSGMELANQPHVIIDIGGGSTELILGDGNHNARHLSSTKVGAVRLTEEFLSTDPISTHELERLRAFVQGKLEWPVEELRSHLKPGEIPKLVGTSGTIECLVMVHTCATLGACPTTLEGHELPLKYLQDLIHRLSKLSCSERSKIPGLSERRAEIIVAGAVVLHEAMRLLGLSAITACERALREGMIVDWMLTHGLIENRLRDQSSIRQRSVLNLAHKYNVAVPAAQRIAEFAISLFDQTQGVLHHWGVEERELLWAAAILHNCGHFVSHAAHHKHSYYLVRHGGLLGYTDTEIEVIANLARYHRKGPPKKRHEPYQSLPKRQRDVVNQISAILKLVSGLDRRQVGSVTALRFEYDPTHQRATLYVHPSQPQDDCALEIWSLTYKKHCFEAEFEVTLTATLEPTVPADEH